jgi:hypothetical protein
MTADADRFRSSLDRTGGGPWWLRAFGWFSSLYLAASLLSVLTVVITVATWYEKHYGREAVAIHIYQAPWFDALFLLLAVNVLGAALVRWPWKRRHAGFVTVHAGLLMVIAGFWTSGHDRLDGMLRTEPGKEATEIFLRQDEIRFTWNGRRPATPPIVDTLAYAGMPSFPRYLLAPLAPLEPMGIHRLARPLVLADDGADGLRLRLTGVCVNGAPELGWEAATEGVPRIRFRLEAMMPGAGDFQPQDDRWIDPLAADSFGLGPLHVSTSRVRDPSLVAAFADRTPVSASDGVLAIAWGGATATVPVAADRLPLTVELGGRRIELTALYRRAGMSADGGGLVERSDGPENPVLTFRSATTADGPWQDGAVLARQHLTAAEGLPEVLWRHPLQDRAVPGQQGQDLHLLAGPDGVLTARWRSHARGTQGVERMAPGEGSLALTPAEAPMQLKARLWWLPTAAPVPVPVPMKPERLDSATRWFELEATAGGRTGRAWVPRDAFARVDIPGGEPVLVNIQRAKVDLREDYGFTVRLEDYLQGKDPGTGRPASYTSRVTILPKDGAPTTHTIIMNEPLTHDGVWLFQTSPVPVFDEQGRPTGVEGMAFTAATDPGLGLKYLGSTVLVFGILLMYWLRRPRSGAASP